ncbi:hypothetical protein K3172_05155 [Qipengyuania sp. 6B39]|uniref:hypothetical protein n=1 Tax=Qipengyuania proteolytica TaxID=2867239 RepID=UPI001C8A5C93|nr:hypothetical protein [Qipengyuania proteolytica]MBX7495239.1 hypothetical protein [Qipengyuania proteolytica]
MQALVDLVGGIVGSIQKLIILMLVFGAVIWAITIFGFSSAAPVVADKMAERAERVGEKAIKAAVEERRARELARDGWGYSESSTDSYGSGSPREGAERDASGDVVGGWGSE